MASAWGDSWGAAWGDSWGTREVAQDVIRNFSGYYSLKEWRNWKRNEPEKLPVERSAADVIEAVALRQVADARLDEQQRLEELRQELRLERIEMRSAHIESMNALRESIIRDEIARLIHAKMDADDTEILLILAAAA